LDTTHEEFDPKCILLGLSNHEPASSYDRSPIQQSKVTGHEYVIDRNSQSSHAIISDCFQLAGACYYSVLAGPFSGISALHVEWL